jgi:large subunit ribosomal protein L21e
MTKMSHGPRAGSRTKMTKRIKEKGMPTVNRMLQSFEVGDLAAIKIEPAVHKGMPHHGFHGYTGRISGKQGDCYLVSIKVGSVVKNILAAPVHLKKIEG